MTADDAGAYAEDFRLAALAAAGDPAAIRIIEEQYLKAIAPALVRFDKDETLQRVRYRLFAEQPPRILQYSGRGSLKSWLRVVAVREALMLARERKRETHIDEAEQILDEDPELKHMKVAYGAQFKVAFAASFELLEPAERNMLRYQFVEGLTPEQIARMQSVHRTTIVRSLQRVRAKLFDETRAAMMRQTSADEAELESIFRLIESRLEVSLHRLLTSELE